MSESKFKDLQKEVCAPELEPPPLKKFCAPCVPNQSYIEPDWEFVEVAEPYFNEKQCEYQITMTVNKFGDSFTASQFRKAVGPQSGKRFGSREALLRSYVHPAIVLILEEYGRIVADQIICASFPSVRGESVEQVISEFDSFEGAFVKLIDQKVDPNRVRCKDFGTSTTGIDPSEPFDFQRSIITMSSKDEVENPFALELYTQVKDFYFDPVVDILKVHIGIPAFIVDQVPERPSRQEIQEEAETPRESVVIEVSKLFGQIKRLEASLQIFGKYQSYFYQTQNGFLKFKDSGKDFYATRMSAKISQFYADLKKLAAANDVNIRSNIPSVSKTNSDNIRIEFKAGANNPYKIKAIYAWREGCEEIKLRKGFKKFKKYYDLKATVMNYVAKIGDIDNTLQARETTPWLDFLVKYTFPLIIVDYGTLNMQSVGDTLGKCVENNVRDFGGELKDYILNEALSFLETMSFQYSSAASCEELYSTANQPEVKEFEEDFLAGTKAGIDTKKNLKDEYDSKTEDERVSDAYDKMFSDINNLEEKIRLSRIAYKSIEHLLEERESDELDFDLNGGDPAVGREIKRDIKKYIKQLENIDEQIEDDEKKIQKITKKANEIATDIVDEDGMSGRTSRYLNRKARRARNTAARRARRNARSHPYAKKAAKAAIEEFRRDDTILGSLIDWEKYERDGKLTRKKFEKNEDEDSFLKDVLSRLTICNANAITINAVRCLFSGVTKERAFDKMFRAAMKAMDLDVFGFFIGGLPPEAQSDLRKKFNDEFGDIPLPWEEDYDPGEIKSSQYKTYLSSKNVPEKNTLRQERRDSKSQMRDLKKAIGEPAFKAEEELVALNILIEELWNFINLRAEEKGEYRQGSIADVGYNIDDQSALLNSSIGYRIDDRGLLVNSEGQQQQFADLENRKKFLEENRDPRMDLYNQFNQKVTEADTQISNLPTNIGEVDFKNLSDEEKRELIAQQQQGQGTFGTALGNIQEEIVNAYIEYIFDVLNIDQIADQLSRVPGGTLVFNTLDQIFKCSTQGLFNPPIKSFLSTLSLDVCGEKRHIGLAVPSKIKDIQNPSFSRAFFLKKLKNSFVGTIERVMTRVLTMLLLKLFETVDNALCKTLNAVSQAAIGTFTGGPQASLSEAFADAFCPNGDEDDLDQVQKNLFGNALGKGAAPDSAYDCLFEAVNGTMSKREIIDLLTNTPNNMDDATASKFALLVNSRCPELSSLLGNVEDVKDAFASIGKYIPPELREYLRNQNDEDLDAPIYDAICLTQEELDLWNANRKNLYLNNGLDEETADELINKANDRALNNLESLADILQSGPEGLMEQALDSILKQADPLCSSDPAAIVFEDDSLAARKEELMNDYFKRIESNFLRDLIGERNSLLGNILIDTQGNHLQQHNRQVNIGDRTVLFANYVDTADEWTEREENASRFKKLFMEEDKKRGMFPETVGVSMLNQLKEIDFKYKTNKDKPQIQLAFTSTIAEPFRDTVITSLLNYKLNHNLKSTQRVYIDETIKNPPYKPDTNLVANAIVNQHFDNDDIADVDYDFMPNEIKLFSDLVKRRSGSSVTPKRSKMISLFDNLNNKALGVIRDSIVKTPDGNIPVGFNYGYRKDQGILFEDLLYVNPDADPNDDKTWEYTHKEEDAILGKSATENPRVHFLDPAVHGGKYKYPKIYIEPASYNGWLGAIQTFIPQLQTCEDKDNGFLNMTEIAQRAKQVERNVPVDARLNEPLSCRHEVPYDRQIMPANHGLIEGIVISTIRAYASEFIVRGFPIFGSIQFNEGNFDLLLSKALANHMKDEMSNAGVFSNISRLAYYLLFLEQSVQVVQRQIVDGLMEETDELKAAAKIINKAQNNFERVRTVDIYSGFALPDGVFDQLYNGSRILAYGNQWQDKSQGEMTNLRALNTYNINLARKVKVIYDTQKEAEVFLAALVSREASNLSKKLNLDLRPRPHVFDIRKYMLSTGGIVDNSDIKSGLTTVEQEVVEGSSMPPYGTIRDCAGPDLQNPVGSISRSIEDIKKTGVLYLEKYVRVISKDSTDQVMKVSEFQSMMLNRSIYDENAFLSDYFGNAQIIANKVIGSIGVKFGVRVMMCLDRSIGLNTAIDRSKDRVPNSVYSDVDQQSIRVLCFPVASYENDIIDVQIKDLDLQDTNLGEDIKCYVDRLSETQDFKLLFDDIIKTRSFCSIFGIYCFQNLIHSIGVVEVEDESDRIMINQAWKGKILDGTKKLLRKQFRSVYSSQDDTKDKRRSRLRASNTDFLKNLIPDVYLNIRGVGFLQRLRIVDAKPFDENGKPCVNEFQSIFED